MSEKTKKTMVVGELLGTARELLSQSAVRSALLQRAWSVGSGPFTAILILRYVGSVEQGYYFAFLSLGSIVMFFELGFGQIVVQAIAHDVVVGRVAGAVLAPDGRLVAEIARRWYIVAGCLFALFATLAGLWWFHGAVAASNWRAAWVLYALAMGLSLGTAWLPLLAEGFGNVALVYRLRLVASISGSVALWITLSCGGKYYGLVVQQIVQVAVTWYYVSSFRTHLNPLLPEQEKMLFPLWRTQMFPLQWRSAIIVASSFFLFQSSTLVAFKLLGPVEAGKVGFAVTVSTMLGSLVLLFVSVNAVKLGGFAANKQWTEFDAHFKRFLLGGLAAGVAGAVVIDLILLVAGEMRMISSERLLSQPLLWCFFAGTMIAATAQTIMIRMRCLKQEPFAWQNLSAALIWPILAITCGKRFGVTGLSVGYLALLLFGLAVPIYVKFRRNEHLWRNRLDFRAQP